jgi:hypothetical protein
MERVVPWPGPDGPGYINLHFNWKNNDPIKRPGVGGWPFKNVDAFISRAAWVESTTDFYNCWMCMSQQSECTTNTKGKPKAVRKAGNAVAVKAIWVDIDVKPCPPTWLVDHPGEPWTHYETISDAEAAFDAFCKKVGLPPPSFEVNSGGGLHVYWASHTPLSPDEWRPYAHGLKAALLAEGVLCDAALTTDIARLLRVPDTLNHKYDPPRKVELLHLGQTYDFQTALSVLHGVASSKSTTTVPSRGASSVIEPGRENEFENGPAAAFAALDPADAALTAGIKLPSALVEPFPIFEKCAFLRDALKNGGRDYDNPLWHLSVLPTVFMKGGNELAHRISQKHPAYSEAETQALYERKLADRARGIGPPRCATIQGAGCKACGSCSFLAEGKTPVHLAAPVTATVNPSASSQTSLWSSTAMSVVFSNIPHRHILYGYDLIRGEPTVLGSPGGVGKSALAIGMGISISVGKELLGEKIYGADLTAVIINAEDSTDEIRRRVHAACLAHGVQEHELTRLYVAGADHAGVQAMSFLRTNSKNISELDIAGLTALEALLEVLKPDLVVLDPLIAFCSHGNINDNSSMSQVLRALKRLAIKFDCAILIVHHTRKGGDAGSAEAISGASSIVNHSRRTIMPVTITAVEALKWGVSSEERWRYFKLVDAKSNLAPRGVDTPVYRLHSIELPNPERPIYPFGDNVQAVVRAQLPMQSSATGSSDEEKIIKAIIDLVDRGKMVEGTPYPYSPTLAGAENARALLPDAIAAAQDATVSRQWSPNDLQALVKGTIKNLQEDGVLVSDKMEDLVPKPGRFRKGRGLRVDHSRESKGSSNAADTSPAA